MKVSTILAVITAGAVGCSAAVAQTGRQPWMKKENPNELAVVTAVDSECPAKPEAIVQTIEGVLARAGIKYIAGTGEEEDSRWLLVETDCRGNGRYNFAVNIVSQGSDGLQYRNRRIAFGFNEADASADSMLSAMHRNIEEAIADYLKANFDL